MRPRSAGGVSGGRLRTARRYSSMASRCAEIREAARAPASAARCASSLRPASSRCADAWISEPMSRSPPRSATNPCRRRRSATGIAAYTASRSSWLRKSTSPVRADGSRKACATSSSSGSARRSSGRSTIRPTTDGRNRRPTTAPAAAIACAASERWRSRSSTVASIVSGTSEVRTSSAVATERSANMPTSSSTWSGMPSVRSWIASTASSDTDRPSSSTRAMTAVSSSVRRGSRASSARRCVKQPRAPLDEAGIGRDLLDPERRDDEQRGVGEPPGQRADHLEAQVVGPVQVLEGEKGRLGGGVGERIDDVEHVHPAPLGDGLRTALVRRQAIQEGEADRRQRRRPPHRPGQVHQDRLGDVPVLWREPAGRRSEAGARRVARHRPEQARLADPGVARQEQQVAATPGDLLEPALREPKELVATHEDRAHDRSDARHGASLGADPNPASVERRRNAVQPHATLRAYPGRAGGMPGAPVRVITPPSGETPRTPA